MASSIVSRGTRELSRRLHTNCVNAAGYQINYDRLREGQKREVPPSTVQANVKNVVGWRGGAERGFLATYPNCIHVLTHEVTAESPSMATWYRKVLTKNLKSDIIKTRYGILVPITYKQLNPSASREEMEYAHVLGWCVELIRAAAIVTTDTISIDQDSRYGRAKNRIPWAEEQNLGNKAFNDALLIERGVYALLKHYFGSSASLYFEPIATAQRNRAVGRTLGYSLMNYEEKKNRLDYYDFNNWKTLTRCHVSQTNYCLPISLAMNLAGLHDVKLHALAHTILHQMGYYVELHRDLRNCFVETDGTDIEDGRLTWLISVALQRGTPAQKEILQANYGIPDADKVEAVKGVYKEMKLKRGLEGYISETREDILRRIQGISKLDKAGISHEFFFKLMENMDFHNIS